MENIFIKKPSLIIISLIVVLSLYFLFGGKNGAYVPFENSTGRNQSSTTSPFVNSVPAASVQMSSSPSPIPSTVRDLIKEPINTALFRITKKPFGIKVSPGVSPVSPEKFSGYHTGVDFETFTEEQKVDVPIYAICAGPLLVKEYAGGYGGVAVQKCDIDGGIVTVIYGHLLLASIESKVNIEVPAGQKIGILGTGYSAETDGERKHLHLGIHKGSAVNIRGYVASQLELKDWIDAAEYL